MGPLMGGGRGRPGGRHKPAFLMVLGTIPEWGLKKLTNEIKNVPLVCLRFDPIFYGNHRGGQ